MNKPFLYEIRVEGHLGNRWSEWFEGLSIKPDSSGETVLLGLLPDQAALFGVLMKVHNLNLTLISVQRSLSDTIPGNSRAPVENPASQYWSGESAYPRIGG